MMQPNKGKILISEPFLPDPNFFRTVILLVEHNQAGTLGFVLNQETELLVSDLFGDFASDAAVYLGGPVAQDTFHYIHNIGSLKGAVEVLPGLYWGGDFEQLQFFLAEVLIPDLRIRYFAGYSGWSVGQLDGEIAQKSWIVGDCNADLAFLEDAEMWRTALKVEGGKLSWMSNAPEDISLN